jgi:hypothetical protein
MSFERSGQRDHPRKAVVSTPNWYGDNRPKVNKNNLALYAKLILIKIGIDESDIGDAVRDHIDFFLSDSIHEEENRHHKEILDMLMKSDPQAGLQVIKRRVPVERLRYRQSFRSRLDQTLTTGIISALDREMDSVTSRLIPERYSNPRRYQIPLGSIASKRCAGQLP